ncbi:MAG: hypothetical protein Ct9H90mP22_5280 [Gammaproteobacteria bacterium]|nr:MAG: hypothetical protein Ct9H90mP22_5280 [Gammaproteobacteria bacterium]
MGWQSMMQDIKKAKNYREVFSTIFGPPNTEKKWFFLIKLSSYKNYKILLLEKFINI